MAEKLKPSFMVSYTYHEWMSQFDQTPNPGNQMANSVDDFAIELLSRFT